MNESLTTDLSRRGFLKTAGTVATGLVIGFHLPLAGKRAAAIAAMQDAQTINAWIKIAGDNTVTMMVASAEMGQGVYTSLPMLIAEELEVDWQQVKAEMAPVAPDYVQAIFNIQGTGGSTSIRAWHEVLRQVGANVRRHLIMAAAADMNVAVLDCEAKNGIVTHAASGKTRTYGAIATKAANMPMSEDKVPLKDPKDWKILGTPAKRLDTPLKVTGKAGFGVDVQLDGLLVATVRQCPVFGGKLKSVDDKPALAINGVKAVIPMDDAYIVVGSGYWPEKKGADALKPEWDFGKNANNSSAAISKLLHDGLNKPGNPAHSSGDADGALANAVNKVEATYEVPLLAHSTMEPMNTTAHVHEDGVDIWSPTQGAGIVPTVVNGVLGTAPEKVRVHTTFLGGGFGRRFEMDFIVHAVVASSVMQAPVKVIWSREEDTQHDFYRPPAVQRLTAGLSSEGKVIALTSKIVSPSIFSRIFPDWVQNGIDQMSVEGIADSQYVIENSHVDYLIQEVGVPVGFWRAVGNSQNGFIMESFIDELANAAKTDAVAFRRELLANKPDNLAVLNKVAEAGNWGKAQAGRMQGIAIHESFGSIVGEIVEISMLDDKVKLEKVTCVVDCGTIINPDTVEAQMQSSIVYALTAALFGKIDIENGRVKQSNFHDYQMARIAHIPEINVVLAPSGRAIGGIGEVALPPLAPALANAVFAATGKRMRKMPFADQGVVFA